MNAHILNRFVENSYLFKKIIPEKKDDSAQDKVAANREDTSRLNQPKFTFLSDFWKKLIERPQSFSATQNYRIADVLRKEQDISARELLGLVLAKKLNSSVGSLLVQEAIERTNQIFHEDHPADFILEYEGERLGMALLDVCYNSRQEPKTIYRFRPDLKSFNGLY